jgi:hypothetical protein
MRLVFIIRLCFRLLLFHLHGLVLPMSHLFIFSDEGVTNHYNVAVSVYDMQLWQVCSY